jgi:anaerobic magnesium-protoporphyrin IX monomethyl ester cyclase
MRVLFLRPPRYQWYVHSESSSFWQPLGFASIAAYLRNHLDYVQVKIKDCCIEKMGWKSTKRFLMHEKVDILCIGEETVSSHEGLKAIHIFKQYHPDGKVVTGGPFFSNMYEEMVTKHPIDFVVHGEGEIVLYNLLKEMQKREPNFRKVKGISFFDDKIISTDYQKPIEDMDTLPMPAYDLLPMHKYGNKSKTHKRFVAIEHSRGCASTCNFCTLWKTFGKPKTKKNSLSPFWRTKTADRMIEEIKILKDKYRRETFSFVDPSFNMCSRWSKEFSEKIIKEGLDIDMTSFYRTDKILDDYKRGDLGLQFKAGMKQLTIGVERTTDSGLDMLNKKHAGSEETRQALDILSEYPEVFTIGTYIYGIPTETKESLREFYENLKKLKLDVGIPIPLTPNPGTVYFEKYKDLIEEDNFLYYNFTNPIMRSNKMTRRELLFSMLYHEIRIRAPIEQKKHTGIKRRRTGKERVAASKVRASFNFGRAIIYNYFTGKWINFNKKPDWYDS